MVRKGRTFSKPHTCRIIGVAGSRRGVGVTHFCILSANYLSGCMGKKTAVLEWNNNGDFERIEKICTGKRGKEKCFSVLDVSYYRNAGAAQLAECMASEYQYIIVDFGVYSEEKREELLRCGSRVLIGSFTEWQEEEFLHYLKKRSKGENSWIYAAVFGSGETRREVRKKMRASVLQIPYADDAFLITSVLFKFFRNFFED